MTRRKWKAPNFRCTVKRADGKTVESWVTWAGCKEDLHDRLDVAYRPVRLTLTVTDYDFQRSWATKAETLTAAAKAARGAKPPQAYDFDRNKIWGALKEHLFTLFDDKCAYCESSTKTVTPGDVEHYRPKGAVADDDRHPGYYWLAYHVSNLLPACDLCNRGGKGTKFPVRPGTRAYGPDELDAEESLLLNPYDDDNPVQHLKVDRHGVIWGRTDKGETSIHVYRLWRRHIREGRRDAMKAVKGRLDARLAVPGKPFKQACVELIEELYAGRDAYSLALIWELLYLMDEYDEDTARIVEQRDRDSAAVREQILAGNPPAVPPHKAERAHQTSRSRQSQVSSPDESSGADTGRT